MFSFSKKKNPHDACCMACHVIVAFLLFLASIASLVGVVMAHYSMRSGILAFGSMTGSLSLIALAVCLAIWMHAMKKCMVGCDMCGTNGKK